MKLLLDFFPILLFFGAFKIWGIFVATTVAIVATLFQLGWMRYRSGRTEPMQWLSLVVIVVFGGATLIAQDETFIKWKPTVLYWAMAGGLLIGQVLGKNGIRALMGSQMSLPDAVWVRVNLAWMGFFAFMGALNLWVAYQFSTAIWVNFKLFGGIGLMFAFVLAQALVLGKYMKDGDEADSAAPGAQEKNP